MQGRKEGKDNHTSKSTRRHILDAMPWRSLLQRAKSVKRNASEWVHDSHVESKDVPDVSPYAPCFKRQDTEGSVGV